MAQRPRRRTDQTPGEKSIAPSGAWCRPSQPRALTAARAAPEELLSLVSTQPVLTAHSRTLFPLRNQRLHTRQRIPAVRWRKLRHVSLQLTPRHRRRSAKRDRGLRCKHMPRQVLLQPGHKAGSFSAASFSPEISQSRLRREIEGVFLDEVRCDDLGKLFNQWIGVALSPALPDTTVTVRRAAACSASGSGSRPAFVRCVRSFARLSAYVSHTALRWRQFRFDHHMNRRPAARRHGCRLVLCSLSRR